MVRKSEINAIRDSDPFNADDRKWIQDQIDGSPIANVSTKKALAETACALLVMVRVLRGKVHDMSAEERRALPAAAHRLGVLLAQLASDNKVDPAEKPLV